MVARWTADCSRRSRARNSHLRCGDRRECSGVQGTYGGDLHRSVQSGQHRSRFGRVRRNRAAVRRGDGGNEKIVHTGASGGFKMKLRLLLGMCAAVASWQVALAGPPGITELKPRGAEIGRPFTLTVLGRNVGEGARITSTLPASFTLVTPPQTPGVMQPPGRSAAFLVEPKQDAAPGLYPIRIETPAGISNILLFSLGTFPEVTEEESLPSSLPNRNDSIETAEPVRSTPVVVNGTLKGPERDIYRVYGKAAERRVFEVEARRCGSAIDPVLRILDGSGKQLARSGDSGGAGLDARIEFTFPSEGNYYVEVTDARFSTQAQNFYRLKMGSYRYAEGIFPLGGRRGEQVPVSFFGGRAGAGVTATADLRKTNPAEALTMV